MHLLHTGKLKICHAQIYPKSIDNALSSLTGMWLCAKHGVKYIWKYLSKVQILQLKSKVYLSTVKCVLKNKSP